MRVLDTNVLIYYLQGEAIVTRTIDEWIEGGEPFLISALTVVELLSSARLTQEEMERIERFISTLTVVPVDTEVARLAARFRRQQHVKLADAVIASTAFLRDARLVTRNVADFRRIQVLVVEAV